MKIYFLKLSQLEYIHTTLNRIHIPLRVKPDFQSELKPSELFIDNPYCDIIYYTSHTKKIKAVLYDNGSSHSPKEWEEFLISHNLTLDTLDYAIIVGGNYSHQWDKYKDNLCYLEGINFEGQWSPYFLENLHSSIIIDLYKNMIMGQIQKDFF